jgi:PAS domain S-box-containing protein
MAEAVLSHLKERTLYDMECRVRTREHGYRWFRTRGKAVWDESGRPVRMAGFISDISERKMAEEALRQSSERFRQLFEQSEDAIMFFKPGTSDVIDVNATAEKLFGYSKGELKRGGVELLCRPEDLDRLSGLISGIRNSTTSYLNNIVNLRKDGSEINVSMRGKVVTIQGVALSYCTFRNITDRVRTEEKVREIQARLIQANKMTSLGLLVSSVAHEVNNPNNFIMANSQLLARMWDDALRILREYHRENDDFLIAGIPFTEIEEHSPQLFEGITEGSRRIKEIIDNLKNFARQDRRVAEADVDVNRVASSAVTMLQHEIVKYTNRFSLDLAQSLPGVRGSSQQLAQVIINLLMNACQSLLSREGGICLSTRFDPSSGQVIIAVRDEGCGMNREDRSRILEPFFTTKLDSGGTGLGLSICQSIVKEHGWSLDFISSPGKGSTFFVRVPAAGAGELG